MTGLQILHSNQSPLEFDSREERPIGPGLLCTATTGCYCQRVRRVRNVGPSSFSEFLCKKMIIQGGFVRPVKAFGLRRVLSQLRAAIISVNYLEDVAHDWATEVAGVR